MHSWPRNQAAVSQQAFPAFLNLMQRQFDLDQNLIVSSVNADSTVVTGSSFGVEAENEHRVQIQSIFYIFF